ncbi:MAG: N-acetyl sugar amidotransferase [Alteromonadales bacterium]|nr:N-acetyl sugar amidotransferase [Alteromonadales bacterium]
MKSNYQICSQCILDTSDPKITFDKNGVCNYCHSYKKVESTALNPVEAEKYLKSMVAKIKDSSTGEYDCIVGMSGGVDSTYVAYLAKEYGLNPLAVHIDAGWNSEIAVKNIESATNILKIDLETIVLDWQEIRDLQRSYFLASVPDCDVPQDHAFVAGLYKLAAKYNIKYMLSGHNNVTEFILPPAWGYDSNDLTNLLDIHRQYGAVELKTYPKLGLFERTVYYRLFKKLTSFRILNYVPYIKSDVRDFIENNLDWKDYGGKHFESRFTKFFQAYYLPTKFGFDKRRAHLSNLIASGQITREEALLEFEQPQYDQVSLEDDKTFFLKKLGFSEAQWVKIMAGSPKSHQDFASDYQSKWFKILKAVSAKLKS